MKRRNFLLLNTVILFSLAAFTLRGQDRMLLDFDTLVEDIQIENNWQNEATLYLNPETGEKESLHPSFWKHEKIASTWETAYVKTGVFNLDLYPIPEDERRYPGQWALHVSGTLDSEYPYVSLTPPFKIPGEQRFEGYGLTRDMGPIRNVTVNIQNNGSPLALTLQFEDELGFPFDVTFDIDGVPGAWYQYMFTNPSAYLESRFPEFRFDYIRLVSIWLYASDVQEYWTERSEDMVLLSEEEKMAYERNNSILHVTSDIDFLLKDIIIGGMEEHMYADDGGY